MTEDIITARLRQQVADLRAALDACAAASPSGAVLAALADGELTATEPADLTGQHPGSLRHHVRRLLRAGLVEPAYIKDRAGVRGATAYRLVTGSPA